MTEVTILYTDPYVSWFQSAPQLFGYLWVTQNGQVVGGSQDEPTDIAPVSTGSVISDINTWIQAVLTSLTGDASEAYDYPGALAVTGWGTAEIPTGYKSRPFVALAYSGEYTFGNMNVPPNNDGEGQRVFNFKIQGRGGPIHISTAFNAIESLATDNITTLKVLELNQA